MFEVEASRRGRVHVFLRAQLPFVSGVVFLMGVTGVSLPPTISAPAVVMGAVLSGVATLLALLAPWEKLAPPWMMTVAVLDLLAVALLRAELFPFIPAVSILAIFPVL